MNLYNEVLRVFCCVLYQCLPILTIGCVKIIDGSICLVVLLHYDVVRTASDCNLVSRYSRSWSVVMAVD